MQVKPRIKRSIEPRVSLSHVKACQYATQKSQTWPALWRLKSSMCARLPGHGRGRGRGLGTQASHIVRNVLHHVRLLPVDVRDDMFAAFGLRRQRGTDAAAVAAHLCGLHVPVLISTPTP